MTTLVLDVTKAKTLRSSKMMSDEEKKEILDFLKAAPDDETAIPKMMELHNCSKTTIAIICLKDLYPDMDL